MLHEDFSEEQRENSELMRRRRELVERTTAQESEMEGLKRTIITLENKVSRNIDNLLIPVWKYVMMV